MLSFLYPIFSQRIRAVYGLQACTGFAPEYKPEVQRVLRGVLTACRHILAETCSPLYNISSGKDLVPEMLRGSVKAGSLRHSLKDLSGFHTCLLWGGNTIVAVGESLADTSIYAQMLL